MEKRIKTTNEESVKNTKEKDFESAAQGLESLVDLLYEHKLEEAKRDLEICRKLQTACVKRASNAKWHNKWFYELVAKRAINKFLMCAGYVYFLEHDLKDQLATLKDNK